MQRILSFEQGPSLSVPLRFFLTAPLFAMLAALLLMWQGPEALVSRWSPFTLALTHLLTLGVLSTSMIGALIQLLPVVGGVDLPRPHLTASVVHALLTVGTLLLSAAFWWSVPLLFKLALLCLIPGFVWLLATTVIGLWRAHVPEATATVAAMRLALTALLITVLLGAALGSAFAWPTALSLPALLLTDLHVLWGLLGWVGLLVIGVAYQVVPMFQVTALYPRYTSRWLALGLFLLLVLWSIIAAAQGPSHWPQTLVSALLAIGYTAFALTTLYLLWRRKRPKPDTTTLFWRTAMASLLAAAALWIVSAVSSDASMPLTMGVLFIIGFAYSAINGMLYKIVPFLVWYHLQSSVPKGSRIVPSIRQILPDEVTMKQFWAHLLALLLLVGATIWPSVTRIAAVALCASSFWLWLNLFNATRIYWRVQSAALELQAELQTVE